jgi:uncharacterized membrane protein YgcG
VSQALEAYTVPVETGALAAAVSSALDAGVPPEEVRALAVGAARANRNPLEIARLVTQVADFRRSDLPTAAAVSTVLEGIAKEASPESVEGALLTTKRNIGFSVSLAAKHRAGKRGGERRNELLVKALSLVLDAGFGENALEKASDAIRLAGNSPDYFIACLETMLELGGTPLSRDEVATLVTLAVQKRFSARDLSRLSGLVALKLRDPQPKDLGRADQVRGPAPYDAFYTSLVEEMEKSALPSDFFAAFGYGSLPGQGKPSSGSGTAPGSAGSTGGAGGGGSRGGGGVSGGSGGSSGGKN